MGKRIFLIVLDSFGIGNAPDAAEFGDAGSNTLDSVAKSAKFRVPELARLGLFNIEGVTAGTREPEPQGSYARLAERSRGKDTTTGHWEIAGIESSRAMPVFPNGFPEQVIREFERQTGHGVLCNRPYSGTQVIRDYGEQHLRTGDLIVYTSADSVFQIAANEAVVPVEQLYEYCRIARSILTGPYAVGRVIARPFTGNTPDTFTRTPRRHDFSLKPPAKTLLDDLSGAGFAVIGIGKIGDIFAGQGLTSSTRTGSNREGMELTIRQANEDFTGLCFVNLVDFDMLYGHRNDTDGYAAALTEFDGQLAQFLPLLRPEDILILTADHGCDPATPSTDHSRECVPMIACGHPVRSGNDLGTLNSFGCIAQTAAEYFGVKADLCGTSFLGRILR